MREPGGEFQQRLRRVQEKFGDRLLTWLTILLAVLTFVIIPLHAAGFIIFPRLWFFWSF